MELMKKGDQVTIVGTLRFDQRPDTHLHVTVNHHDVFIAPEDVTLHQRHFVAGDKGYLPSTTDAGKDPSAVEVIATHDCLVWVKYADGGTQVAAAMDLLREPPAPKEEP
ncbi:hypothetical protein [Rhizobium sp. SSA_523]|uniref:hypothetical protein n=1 Tax=Rhizobium sp. SSA_523 TaxID=2952477 RepID=UPI002090ECCD|nr:hypothetical protein [Rhizobium sp. SSA_523]MCO5730146.1 hypothetical protein [Rhizobium sp. SSA_523]WKC25210.1 hypothetical protein QTJ18_14585 [Rhizobium sp. SSA_523]